MYAQDAASVNEFLGHAWDKVLFYDVKYLNLIFSLHKLFTFPDITEKRQEHVVYSELTFEMSSY